MDKNFIPPDDELVLTHWPSDGLITGKICKCCDCGISGRCTASSDFYRRIGDESGILFCEFCLVKSILGVDPNDSENIILTTTEDDGREPDDVIDFEETNDNDPADWWKN